MPLDTPLLCPRPTCQAELVMLGGPGTGREWTTTFECFVCGFQGRLGPAALKERTGIDVLPLVVPPPRKRRRVPIRH